MIKMKTCRVAAILIILAGILGSCSGKATSEDNLVAETVSSVTVQDTTTIVAKFNAVFANPHGAIYAFTGIDGQDYEFWESDTPAKGMEYIKNLATFEVKPGFDNIIFEVSYVNAKREFPTSPPHETVLKDVMQIVELKQIKEASKVEDIAPKQFTQDEMRRIIFFGVEPFWDIQLKVTHAEYRSPDIKGALIINYRRNENDASKAKLSEAMREIGSNALEITGIMKESPVTIRIKRETCSDGMSDDIHPYSVEFIHVQWGIFKGCGRVK